MHAPMIPVGGSSSRRSARGGSLLALGGLVAAVLALGGCGHAVRTVPETKESMDDPDDAPVRDDTVWLDRIGSGQAQTAKACARGRDGVTLALCKDPPPSLGDLRSLYKALGLDQPETRFVAGTTHSLGLSSRSVSGANPRTVVFPPHDGHIPYERLLATSFTRGEQFVELVALDTETLEYNFYLLHFQQACNETRCTPEDLLTQRVEQDWTDWTLYTHADLEDTPLDCLSCHQPFGPDNHSQLLMRQVINPWLHWGGFEGGYENDLCPKLVEPHPGRWIEAEGLTLLGKLEGETGQHAGIPIPELVGAESGRRLAAFLVDAENTVRASDYEPNEYRYEQVYFASTDILCERVATGTSPSWDRGRAEAFKMGLPMPFYGPDVLNPERRAEILAGWPAFLAKHAEEHPLEVAMGLFSEEASRAVGFVPNPEDSAETMLHHLCVRCHADNAPPGSGRARFNASKLSSIEADVARSIQRRIHLPSTDPGIMPPVRFGELPEWARSRIDDYLVQFCPGETCD